MNRPGPLQRLQYALIRTVTRTLKLLGLRDQIRNARLDRQRRARQRAEAAGNERGSWPALDGIDRRLAEILGSGAGEGGYFVEAGANDGYQQSNTYGLERLHGWHGLLIEPIPDLAAQARLNRPRATVVQCALAGDEATKTVRMRFGGLMSTVDGARDEAYSSFGTTLGWDDPYEIDVPVRRLSDVIDEAGAPEIDLLSLDVEGYEAEALAGLDLDRHAPRYVLVEIVDREQDRPAIDAILGRRYREHGWLSQRDLLYVRRDAG